MKEFDLKRINIKAPYKVSIDGKQYVFETQYGLHYEVRFFEEQPIGGCETWQFSFAKATLLLQKIRMCDLHYLLS